MLEYTKVNALRRGMGGQTEALTGGLIHIRDTFVKLSLLLINHCVMKTDGAREI
jgi:hypothetical protein